MDLIDREQAIATLEDLEWYHIFNGELKAGANSKDDTPLYKAEDIYAVLRKVPSAEKTGRWLWTDGVRCSRCNHKLQTTGLSKLLPKLRIKDGGR